MKKKKNITGFTLIELLVVIAIIALLLAILLPGLKRAKDYARRVICAGRLGQIGVAVKCYADTNKDYLPTDLQSDGKRERHSFVVYRFENELIYKKANGDPLPFRYAHLYEAGLIDTPEIFYCPNNTDDGYKYESYSNPAPWGRTPQNYVASTGNPWVRIGYTYFPVERNAKISTTTSAPESLATKFTLLNLNIPHTTDVLHKLSSLSHQYNGRYDTNSNVLSFGNYAVNALYGDGHVSTCTDQTVYKNKVWDELISISSMERYDYVYYTIVKLIGP
jgi:prepilin-type N-terminal cleavage/methylation domain-containing protein/prepilin-type processing-associated H-X9-DG protein